MKATERALRQNQKNLITGLQQEIELLNSRLSASVDKQILLLNRVIEADELIAQLQAGQSPVHLNPAGDLPPVNCPLLIELEPGVLVHAERTGFISDRNRDMEYLLASGKVIHGRFAWTYP